MKRVLSYLLVLFTFDITCANAQVEPVPYTSTAGVNSVRIYEATTPEKDIYSLMGDVKTRQTTQYYDGLGRPIQTVVKQGSPLGKDLVAATHYDEIGRVPYTFLPFVATQTPGGNESLSNGEFKLNPFQQQKAFYQSQLGGQNETYFYGQAEYDGSPLNRVVKTMLPGNSWVGSNVGNTAHYDFNQAEENVHIWDLPYGALRPSTSATQVYATGQLSKITSIDEKGKKVITYTDLGGRIILKKVQEKEVADLSNQHTGWVCTYYVYDDLNQLRFILTPKAVAYLDSHDWVLTDNVVGGLCFTFNYDDRGRQITKKQPGVGESFIVYDQKDRVVLVQEANQNKVLNSNLTNSQWNFTLYDELDRPIATGLLTNNKDRSFIQDDINNLITVENKTVSAFVGSATNQSLFANCPIAGDATNDNYLGNSNIIFNSITHYDTYDYAGVKPFVSTYVLAYDATDPNIEPTVKTSATLGFITGEKIRILDNDNDAANDKFIFSTAYYDEKGRPIESLTENIKGGSDAEVRQYDFSGKLVSSYVEHFNGANTYTLTSKNEFDKDGRLIKISKNFNNTFFKQLAEYSYDELGRLKTKRLAPGYTGSGKEEMEKLTFDYNIHGALIGINKDYALSSSNYNQWEHYFGMHLGYDNKEGLFAASQYNGSITGVIWKSQGDNSPRKYNYTYDNLGRFTSAQFQQKEKPGDAAWSNNSLDFSVYTTYEDGNGNIASQKQMGVLPGSGIKIMDDLRYSYREVAGTSGLTGNQLKRIDDLGDMSERNGALGDFKDGSSAASSGDAEYSYDANGNLVRDLNKNIGTAGSDGISYNYLNKPVKIILQNKSIVEYTYDASGEKLAKKVTNTLTNTAKTTYYIGDFVYADNELQYILHEEGRVKVIAPVSTAHQYIDASTTGITLTSGKQGVFEYFLKDHLGNTRMVLTEEVQKEFYTGSMEQSAAAEEHQLFGKVNVDNNNNITIPDDNELKRARTNNSTLSQQGGATWTGNNTDFVKLSAAEGKAIGPNMILKVMAGDIINAHARYFYGQTGISGEGTSAVNDIATSLIGALLGSNGSAIGKASQAAISTNLTLPAGSLNSYVTNTQPGIGASTAPKAYLNIVFLDEQFKFLEPDNGQSGVGTTSERVSVANSDASFDPLQQKAPKNGWAYVYLSNESNEPVCFDDFLVTQEHSRIAEESHFYPHGLKINGISAHAFNKLENRYGYQGDFSEEEEESGYNEFYLRSYDPQTARWTGADPYDEFASPYVGMGNDPVNGVDPSGGYIFGVENALMDVAIRTVGGATIGGAIGGLIDGKEGMLKGMGIGGVLGFGSALVDWDKVGGALGDASTWANNKPGQLFNSQNDWLPLTKQILYDYVKQNGYQNYSEEQIHPLVGRYFERVWQFFASVNFTSVNYRRNPIIRTQYEEHRPDGISDMIGFQRNFWGKIKKIKVYQDAAFYEVKAMNGSIYMSTNEWQVATYINVAAIFNPLNTLAGAVHFNLITTSNMIVSPGISEQAGDLDVHFQHIVSVYKKNKAGQLRINFALRTISGDMIDPKNRAVVVPVR